MQLINIRHAPGTQIRPPSEATRARRALDVDVESLTVELRASIDGEVRSDAGSRALYAVDASNYRQIPICVVIPRHVGDLINAMAIARRYGAPIFARGGGTSMAGQCCNAAIVLDFSKYMHAVLDLDPQRRGARVQPGLVLDNLRNAAEHYHLTFAPDPSTHDHCTLGGMIGNNSCGTHSVMGGTTADNVEELEILTYQGLRMRVGKTSEAELNRIIGEGGRRGDIYRKLRSLRDRYADDIRASFPHIPRRISGYNLPALLPENGFDVAKALVGSECTCVLILEAGLRLVPSPPARALVVIGYPDIYSSGDHIPEIMEHGPVGLEGMDAVLVDDMKTMQKIDPEQIKLLPEGHGWLLVEFGGETADEARGRAEALMEALRATGRGLSIKLFDQPRDQKTVWTIRKYGFGAADVPGQNIGWTGWEDSAVPPAKLGEYLRGLRALLNKYGYACTLFGHFGQGCVHTRIDYDLTTPGGIRAFRAFHEEASDLALGFGGSLSGEHGDGQSLAEFLPKMFGPELIRAFEEFKTIWDPDWKMNPGKVVKPYRLDENLKLGTDYRPPKVTTHFQFPDDEFNFARATLRCVGIGECRRESGKTMCPSYRATREEMHSTRGRAHLLFEMLEGDPVKDGWRDDHVKESLDLCLACKGCKGDCPVSVDMATYKAEFLSHYYAGRRRPMHAYSMGLIYWWARLASLMPEVANFFTQTPGLRSVVKALGGISQRRRMPPFATQTFKEWFYRRDRPKRGTMRVILWPDTFNNYFLPATARAAVEVLEAAGCHVVVPRRSLCCGRPLYDFGMLTAAKGLLRRILDTLKADIQAGTPIVGLEPSCVAVFRDELINLFPHDENAKRLSKQTFTLAEFLEKEIPDYRAPQFPRKAIVHGHCHHKAIMKLSEEEKVLSKVGLDFEILDSGCCGMAGSFGFRAEHDGISRRIGELVLLPAVRNASKDTLILADGFSCREQIAQTTDRRGLHLAEVLHLAMQTQAHPNGRTGDYPEADYLRRNKLESARSMPSTVALAGGAVLAGGLLLRAWQRRKSDR
ncbi:MAG TPA: FAD-linked oxidase C-terminal domain-containing protein [Nitrospiraceae bacterium]|nr:FAD-linked oxidase C-terminal domain-containing protein [Nitrospiraceae bacterium]